MWDIDTINICTLHIYLFPLHADGAYIFLMSRPIVRLTPFNVPMVYPPQISPGNRDSFIVVPMELGDFPARFGYQTLSIQTVSGQNIECDIVHSMTHLRYYHGGESPR